MSDKDGVSEFFSDHDFNNKEWGGTIIGKCNFQKMKSKMRNKIIIPDPNEKLYKQVDAKKTDVDQKMPIRLIRLSRFINEVVGKRKLPPEVDKNFLGKPSVIMKLDIEGKGSN